MTRTAVLGLPRIGPRRELKVALEAFWAGRCGAEDLHDVARGLRAAGWAQARAAGIDVVASGDFSLYDHVLDTAWALGAIPARFGDPDRDDVGAYFAMARGTARQPPLQMTKWFDTNYHHLVPELEPRQRFDVRSEHWTAPLRESAALGIATRPVVVGPFTFLRLSKGVRRPLQLAGELVPAYQRLLADLHAAGATAAQIDEPALVLDPTARELDAFAEMWRALAEATPLELSLATYFAGLRAGGVLERVAALAPAELHLDLVRAPEQLRPALHAVRGAPTRLSLGVVDGRNVWAADAGRALSTIETARAAIGPERVVIASSCSLLHVPHEARRETALDPALRRRLAFCAEKLAEIAALRDASSGSPAPAGADRRDAAPAPDRAVRARLAALGPADRRRTGSAAQRRAQKRARMALPELPTTTIGSFPQTGELRAARRDLRGGRLGRAAYEQLVERRIAAVVAAQEQAGLDVLVHGEPERGDMVEHFAERLRGFAVSEHGWVQSCGAHCVKPPILHGDVSRPAPMTVRWWRYAQSLTAKPVKAILTGPVTMLRWSFVRDDLPAPEACAQVALAMRDELADLQAAGARAIQVDEPALREGLPLQRSERAGYLRWAGECFRLAIAPARPDTQIHTHMCYAPVQEIAELIACLDVDVLSVEACRAGPDALRALAGAAASGPAGIGPGVYDTRSPRVPSVEEIEHLLEAAEARIGRDRLWVNPDCGLKALGDREALPALRHMVAAARRRRERPAAGSRAGLVDDRSPR